MKFKKLKLSVAIALIVFILIVGNIGVLGFLEKAKKLGEIATPIDIKKSIPVEVISPTQTTATTIKSNQESTSLTADNVNPIKTSKATAVTQSPATVIRHTRIRTRAS